MARLLYRIGAGSARRPFVVIGIWLMILISTGTAMSALQRPLSSDFKLPGSDFARVLDHVGKQVPAVAGGTGTVVFSTEDGSRFTPAQRRAIEQTLTGFESVDHVTGTVSPFALQSRIEGSDDRLRQAKAKLDAGQERFDDGAHRLRQLTWLVERGDRDIARIQQRDPGDPTLADRQRGQAEGEKLLADGERRLVDSGKRLDQGWAAYHSGRELASLGSGTSFVNEAGNTAIGQIRFDRQAQQVPPEDLERIPRLGERAEASGVEVDYGQDISHVLEPGGIGEVIGVISAAIVLLVMLGSLLVAGVPLMIAFTGVGVALTAGLAATHVVTLHQMAPILGAMLGLAVGIDYALFIVNRHRRQLAELIEGGTDPGRMTRDQVAHAAGLSVGTAGNAVVVAGATVVIALAALCVSGIPVLMQMGLLAAATVAVTVLVALTLTPALLGLLGRRAAPRQGRRGRAEKQQQSRPARPARPAWPDRWVAAVTGRSWWSVIGVVVVLLVVALPALSLRLGLPDGGSEDPDTTAYQAYSTVAKEFGAGANGPILVSADREAPIAESEVVSEELTVSRAIAQVDGVTSVLPVGVSDDRRTIAFQVTPEGGPSSEITTEVVDALRGPVTADLAEQGVDLGVTGATVANIEVSQQLADALPLYVVLVIGLSLILLTVVFRSVVVPLLATAGFLLSVAGSFGAVVAVYQWGWLGSVLAVHEPGAVMSFMPTLLIGILFGLAMDYQMFLVSGMHEARTQGVPARKAVRVGFVSGARVVAAAALIMISVFAGFIFSGMTMVRPIGFGLAVGVLIDAFLIRMTLIPAAMTLLGDRAWWIPAWLDRMLPHLDVEGASLNRDLSRDVHPSGSEEAEAAPDGVPEREAERV